MAASDTKLYLYSAIFSLLVFVGCYYYLDFIGMSRILNKAVADTAILLMGLSMLLSSICYFWNALDWAIVYRKYLGLVGFAYGVTHVILSKGLLFRLFTNEAWSTSIPWAPLTGLIALIIFTIMALISNKFMAKTLGGTMWKYILRTGYAAILFVWLHVVFLKGDRWLEWFNEGMPDAPSLSLLVSVFMVVVMIMRLLLWAAVSKKKNSSRPAK